MSGRFSATDRLTRLLAIIPWVAGHGGASLDEIAAKFAYPKDDLVGDLTGVVQYVGVPPYTPDTMIEVTIENEHVWIHYADYFNRPMRLSTEEAGMLLSAGRAVLGVMGDDSGPLLSALAKLTSALDDPAALDIRLGDASEETMAILRSAIAAHRQVHIDYYSYGRDLRTERTIDPARFFSDEGQWYVAGYCHLASADRVFRVDRIRKATLLDTVFDRPTDPPGLQLLEPGAGLPRVTLDVSPGARWVLDQYPHDTSTDIEDGWTRLTLPVAARPWIERLLVRLGPDVRVVDAPEDLGIAGRNAAAARILARYGR
ncbi:MAG TPA: WYL domain-containing protein [Acidimicrobiales bacterium]|nr:WYL domain-containing protein [Acidimicrobiales bacterium]